MSLAIWLATEVPDEGGVVGVDGGVGVEGGVGVGLEGVPGEAGAATVTLVVAVEEPSFWYCAKTLIV